MVMTHRSAAPSAARALIVWDTASNEPACSRAATAPPQASSTGATADETRPHHGTPRTVTTVSYRDGLPGSLVPQRAPRPFGVKMDLMPPTVPGRADGAVLDGVLERVTFANPETGYTIARIAPVKGEGEVGGGADLITAVGPLLGAQVGGVPAAARPLVQPPEVRPAVRGPFLRHHAARHRRGHP